MANEFHKNLTLDDIHAVPSRIYADITARDADTDFNTDSTNLYKDVVVLSPLSTYRLMTTAPLFQELTNTTAGNVTTSDTLLATQLLLGNGGMDIVTEPDMTYDGVQFQTATVNITSQLDVGGVAVLFESAGDIVLNNIDFLDNTTRDTIEAALIDLPNVASIGTTSGSILGPSGAWMDDGFNVGPGDMFSINFVIVLDGDPVITLKNIAALDATTEATIEAAIDTLANLTSVQGLDIAYADAGEDALWGWVDAESTYRNLTPAEATAAIGAVTTSDVLADNQLLTGNGGVDIVTEPLLVWDGTKMGVGIASPVTVLHIYEDNGLTGINGGVTIEQDGSGDAKLHFVLTGGISFALGIDNSDGDKFKISNNPNFAAPDTAFTIVPNTMLVGIGQDSPITRLHVSTDLDDTDAVTTFESTGANSASTRNFVGTRDPEGLITGNPGDHYHRANGVNSGVFTFKAASAGTAGWEAVQTNAAGVDNVTTSDVLADNQLLTGNGTTDIVTEPLVVWDGDMFGIGIAVPVSRLHVYENTSFTGGFVGVSIEQDGTGDARLSFLLTGVLQWVVGIDNSDGDKFKINQSSGFSTDGAITILPGSELIGLGTNVPDTRLDINGDGGDALRLRSGNASGFTLNQIKMSLDGGALFTHAIKSRHDEFNQFSNAIDFFLWDANDEDDPADVGTLPVLTLKGDGKIGVGKTSPSGIVDILSLFGDTTAIIQMESASNAGTVKLRTGNRDPNAMVMGLGPDVYYADRGVLSGTYENRSAVGDDVWLKRSVLPPEIIQFQNSTELDDLASGGIITISVNTTWHVRAELTTANRIVLASDVFFHITGEFNVTSSITYTGTGTFISGPGLVRIWAQMQLISTSTGTLLDIDGGSGVNLRESTFDGWDDLGTVANTSFFASENFFQNIDAGFTLTNNFIVDAKTLVLISGTFTGSLFTINTNNPGSTQVFSNVSLRLFSATGSLFDLNTRINNNAGITINGCSVPGGGDLFRQSVLTDATINSVADGSIATGTITAMADNGAGGTTISSTTTYFEDEEVTISGTTSYNGTFQIFNVVAGVSFDTITVFVADDATGSVDTERLTLSLAGGHGISIGDSIKVIDTNFYNGFMTTLNVVSDDITINGLFISTNTGSIERELSIDQSDPRIDATDNFGFVDSHSIACAHVNDNSDAVGSITNNVFTDLVFGTAADALISSTTMERWRLVNELNGTFEYIGAEPFDDAIQFDFTVESSGGTVDFRFKWMHDIGAGFVDLPDDVESLVAVGSDAQSVTKKFPLAAVNGDLIKPQITRNSGSSGITVAYATVFAGG